MVEFFLNSSKNGGDIARKLRAWAGPGQTKTTIARNQLMHRRRELKLVVNTTL